MRKAAKLTTPRDMRRDSTIAEKRLWEHLRNRKLDRFKFVRQAPVGPYIADFLCRERNLIVEVDGATHSTTAELVGDRRRTEALKALGYRVIRVQNEEVMRGMDQALVVILGALQENA
ncbi:MAG: endonuclease domain-containing protein [Hyphomicrobiales bacterium]